ncbi:MAG: hypothetical protein A2Y10_15360 [Planctomycetes bacterium GWF2_41_51]|nr:MAG: hypothetical protein A2Y10_15360 [Planctomycetes bacterium GWF2_41_51]HBG26979.1 hypothetical protein [Phycisphaerales bacterium]
MKTGKMTNCLLLVFLIVTDSTKADFTLRGNEQLTFNWQTINGYLYNTSRVFIVPNGHISYLRCYNYSTANMSGGIAVRINSYNYSTVNISSGSVSILAADDSSTINLSSGTVARIDTFGYSTTNISGGNISGNLYLNDYSNMNFFGGTFNGLLSNFYDFSTTTFHGKNFNCGSGLTLNGNRILGTGILSGQWLNGTTWSVNIMYNDPTATILIPEPATLLLFGFGAVMLRKKRL